ncbi:MAG: histidine phosphatase family protein [Thermoguttaceae bacterium]|nr:histidine phosphatase family protein [Thermoguttaceae bacterium]
MYLVRHGATEHNLAQPPRLQGRRLNAPLAPEGRRQAERTAQLLAQVRLEAVYTSPLLRARQTAELIALPHQAPLYEVEAFTEIDVGRWEGMDWASIRQQAPQWYALFEADAGRHGYPEGENFQQVQERTVAALAQILPRHLGQAIAIVAHNVVNRCLLAHVLGIPLAQYRRITQDNCGVSILRFQGEKMKVITLNAVFHLLDGQTID